MQLEHWMSFRHLRLVVAIGDYGSILHAANHLNISQPTASKLLQDLEHTMKTQLFARRNRGVVPTAAGLELIAQARILLSQLDRAGQQLEAVSTQQRHILGVGALLAGSAGMLAQAMVPFCAAHPDVIVNIVEGGVERVLPALLSGEVELVAGRLSGMQYHDAVAQEKLSDFQACIVARRDHPLAGGAAVPADVLARQRWILPGSETLLRRQFDSCFEDSGVTAPRPVVVSNSYIANGRMIRGSDMLSLWPRSLIDFDLFGGTVVEIPTEAAMPVTAFGISTRRGHVLSPMAAAVVDALRDVIATNPQAC